MLVRVRLICSNIILGGGGSTMNEEKLEQVLSKLNGMGQDITRMNDDIQGLKSGQARMEEKVTSMDGRIGSMEERMTSMDGWKN